MQKKRSLVALSLLMVWAGAAAGAVGCSSSSGGATGGPNDAGGTGDGTTADTGATSADGGEAGPTSDGGEGGVGLVSCIAPEVPCYQTSGAASCTLPGACSGFALGCTGPSACSGGQVCCAEFADGGDPYALLEAGTRDGNLAGFDASAYQIRMLVCQSSCGDGFQLCNQSSECQNGGTCAGIDGGMGKVCQVLPDAGGAPDGSNDAPTSLDGGSDGG